MKHWSANDLLNLKNVFHMSNPTNRKSIQLNGLLPMIGENYQSRYQDLVKGPLLPAIFMYHTDPNNYTTTWDDDIWLIDLKYWDHQIYQDEAVIGQIGLISFVPIPVNRMTLFHPGSGKDLLGRYL